MIIDTRTGRPADHVGAPVKRWRATASGRRLLRAAQDDARVLQDVFPQLSDANLPGVLRLLDAFDLVDSHSKFGLSAGHAVAIAGLPGRTGRWWVARLNACGYVRELPDLLPDVREVIPPHWRITRTLLRHVLDVLSAFPESGWGYLEQELRLGRAKVLDDVEPARIGISGATDFDHDVTAQRVLALFVRSPRFGVSGSFSVEPRLHLPIDSGAFPWAFTDPGTSAVAYQPDADFRETQGPSGLVHRSVLEYERYQSRRDAWSHIERWVGYLHTRTLPMEPAILRFVVDSRPRMRAYVELVQAFADHGLDRPDLMPANPCVLAVSSVDRLKDARDPLDERNWARVSLPGADSGVTRRPVLHPSDSSPYDSYFTSG